MPLPIVRMYRVSPNDVDKQTHRGNAMLKLTKSTVEGLLLHAQLCDLTWLNYPEDGRAHGLLRVE